MPTGMSTMGRATARAPMEKQPEALKAPLFKLLVEQLDATGRRSILDLGAASTPMLSLLGRSRSRVEIADIASDDGVERMNGDVPAEALVELAESLMPKHGEEDAAIDVVFCWDIPNYVKPVALSALMSAIARRAHPGTLAHALVVYSERSMPARPGRFVPTEDARLLNRGGVVGEIAAPRYSPDDLRRIMRGYEIERAMLLANGMQEFLFRLEG